MRIDREQIEAFRAYLTERECAGATVAKYMRDVQALCRFCGGELADSPANKNQEGNSIFQK